MADNEITTRFLVDVNDLKGGIQEARRYIRQANADFKASTSGMDDWRKSSDGLTAKLTQLGKVLAGEQKILQEQEKNYREVVEAQGADSRAAQELAIKITNQQAAVNKTTKEFRNMSEELKRVQQAENLTAKNGKSVEENLKAIAKAEDLTAKNGKSVEENLKDIAKAEDLTAQNGKSVEENLKDIAKAEELAARNGTDVETELKNIARAEDEAARSAKEAGESAKDSSKGWTILKDVISNLATTVVQSAISGLKDFAVSVVETGRNFESSMSNVAALSGATGEELQLLTDTAREYGATTQFSASEAADALGYMALAGWDAEKSASELGGVLNLAAASGMGLAEASDMVTDYLSAFSNTAMTASEFSDKLAYAQANSNTSATQLGEAYQNCAANLNAAGQDMETVTSLLASMANQGLKGSRAGTALSAMMRDLTAKMKDGSVQIGDTNVAVMDAEGNYRDLTEILRDVEAATNGMGDAEKAAALSSTFTSDSIKGLNLIMNEGVNNAAWFEEALRGASVTVDGFAVAASELGIDVEAMRKAFEDAGVSADAFDHALTYSQGSAELFVSDLGEFVDAGYNADEIIKTLGISVEDLQTAMDNSAGSAEQMAAIMNDNLNGDLKSLNSAWEDFQLTLYDSANGPMRDVIQRVTNGIIPALKDLVNGVDGADVALGEALGSTITTALESVISALPQAINIGVTIITTLIEGIIQALPMLVTAVLEGASNLLDALARELPNLVLVIIDVIPQIIQALMDMLPVLITSAINLVTAIVEALPQIIQALVEAIPTIVTTLVKGLLQCQMQVMEAAITLLMALVEAVPEILVELAEAIPEIITTIVDELSDPQFGNMLLDSSISLLMTIVDAVPTIIDELGESIPEIVTAVIDNLMPLGGDLAELAGMLLEDLGDWAGEAIENGSQKAVEFITGIISKIAALPGEVWSWLLSTNDKIHSFFVEIIKKGAEKTSEFVKKIVDYIKELPDKIWTRLIGTIDKVFEFRDSLVQKGLEAGQGFLDNICGILDGLPGKMLDIGSNIVSGIWEGISGNYEWIKKKITGWVGNITDFIKNLFGIHSPSSLMRDEVGQFIAKGVAEGITEYKDEVNNAMQGLADEATNKLDFGVAEAKGHIAVDNMSNRNYGGMSEKALSQLVETYLTANQNGQNEGAGTNQQVINLTTHVFIGQKRIETIVKDAINNLNYTSGGR